MNTAYYRSEHIEIIHLKNKPVIYSEHNHVSVYTIGLVMDGFVTLKSGEQNAVFSSNDFFVTQPFQMHALLLPEKYDMLSICIHKDFVDKYKLNDLYNIVVDYLSEIYPNVKKQILMKAIEALYHCEPFNPPDDSIKESACTIWHNPEYDISIQNIADKTHFSKFHFIRRFKENIGMTPHKFQVQNKIRRAQRMIENNESLTVIAMTLGFFDQSHFIKCFKNIVGITPSEYKQSCKIFNTKPE